MRVSRAAFRKRRNYALALLAEGVAPLIKVVARATSAGSSTHPTTWRRGLIIGHSHVGDVLYRTCSLEQLKAGLPECRWDYLTSPVSSTVLLDNPSLNGVLPLVDDDHRRMIGRDAFRQLRATKYDVVLCTNFLRHLPDFALAAALGAPNRVGFGDKGYSGLLTLPVAMNYPQPFAGYFRTLVSTVVGTKPDWPLQPHVFPRVEHRREAESCLADLGLDPALPILACTATTRQVGGAWPPAFFADVISRAVSEQPSNVILFGAAQDEATLCQIGDSIPSSTHVVAGKLDWLAFAEALRRCDALLATDSGPRHLANAVGTPVAFVRNLSGSYIETGVYCANEVDLAPPDVEYLRGAEVAAVVKSVSVRDAADRLVALLRKR